MTDTDMKICEHCKKLLSVNQFSTYKNNSAKGIRGVCKECISQQNKQSYKKNWEKNKAKRKDYSRKNNKRIYAQYSTQRKEEIKKTCALWRKKNREKSNKAMNRAWAKRRALLMDAIPPNADLNVIKDFYNNCPSGMTIDHIIPLSKGSLHDITNLQYLTKSENSRKGAKICPQI